MERPLCTSNKLQFGFQSCSIVLSLCCFSGTKAALYVSSGFPWDFPVGWTSQGCCYCFRNLPSWIWPSGIFPTLVPIYLQRSWINSSLAIQWTKSWYLVFIKVDKKIRDKRWMLSGEPWHCYSQTAAVFSGHHALSRERKEYPAGFTQTRCVMACSSPMLLTDRDALLKARFAIGPLCQDKQTDRQGTQAALYTSIPSVSASRASTSCFSSVWLLGLVLFCVEEGKHGQSSRSNAVRPHFKFFHIARVCIKPELPPV